MEQYKYDIEDDTLKTLIKRICFSEIRNIIVKNLKNSKAVDADDAHAEIIRCGGEYICIPHRQCALRKCIEMVEVPDD